MTKEEEKQAILKALAAPQSYSVDGETINQRSAADFEKLLKMYKKAGMTTKNACKNLGIVKISTPGSHEK